MLTRLKSALDPYILALLGVVVLASLLPVRGEVARLADGLANAGIVLLFFLHGAKLSREALYESVLAPSAAISHSYETWTAVCNDGRSVTGMLISRTPQEVVIRGADAVDVTIPAREVEDLVKQPVSLMPADLAATLTADELVHVVAWMETLRSTQ